MLLCICTMDVIWKPKNYRTLGIRKISGVHWSKSLVLWFKPVSFEVIQWRIEKTCLTLQSQTSVVSLKQCVEKLTYQKVLVIQHHIRCIEGNIWEIMKRGVRISYSAASVGVEAVEPVFFTEELMLILALND